MNYFTGIVLCIATVNAESIPDVLALNLVQDFFYQTACKTTIALRLVQPQLEPDVKSIPVVPDSAPEAQPPALPQPKGFKPEVVIPFVLTSPEVEAAKAKAIALYGKEAGFVSVLDKIMTTKDGQRFLYINIKGDGNCGFYAMGVDRATFVKTIEDLVKEHHDSYQEFVKERSVLVCDIGSLQRVDEMSNIADRVNAIDKVGDVTTALKLFTDFATEKGKYHVELFQDAWNRVIKDFKDIDALSKIKSNPTLSTQVTDFINVITSASLEGINIEEMTKTYDALIAALASISVATDKVQVAFKDWKAVCRYGDVDLFEKGKLRLINKIQNLTPHSYYEAFLIALQHELIASGINAADFDEKEKVLAGVRAVFSVNRGSATWFPGGLFAAIKDRLGVSYNIWARDSGDIIKMYSGSGRSGEPAKGSKVRNVFFAGGHYDMLIPMDE